MIVTIRSRYSFSDTVRRLSQTIAGAGNTIFATIDQAAAAASAGLSLRPTTLIVFGNPKAGTPLMQAFPLTALDLPLKLLIWEQDGDVSVAFVSMSEIAARYGVAGFDAQIAAIDHALNAVTQTVA